VIARTWRGWSSAAEAPAYLAHLETATFPALGGIDGFEGSYVLRRDVDGEVEFLVVTLWSSLDAVRAFAGDDHERAVVPLEAERVLARFDPAVTHYEVALRGGAA
jgi:heme-degrading monooxygenase HmoA